MCTKRALAALRVNSGRLENAGVENGIREKMQGWKMQE